MIKFLQGRVLTHSVLGGITIHPLIANFFLHCVSAKNYENWLTVDNIIAIKKGIVFWATVYVRLANHNVP